MSAIKEIIEIIDGYNKEITKLQKEKTAFEFKLAIEDADNSRFVEVVFYNLDGSTIRITGDVSSFLDFCKDLVK